MILFRSFLALMILTTGAFAQLTWGVNGAGGTGTWDSSMTADWYNGTSNVTWDGNIGIFSGTAGTVTVNGTVLANQLNFTTNGYTLTPVNSGTIQGPTSGTLDFVTPASITATINSAITSGLGSTGAVLQKDGDGELILGGNVTFYPQVQINSGTIDLAPGASLIGANVTMNSTSTAGLLLGQSIFIGGLNGGGQSGGVVQLDGNVSSATLMFLSGTGTFGGVISQNISFSTLSSPNQTFTNTNTTTGTANITSGVIALDGQGSIANMTVSVTNSGTLVIDNTGVSGVDHLSNTNTLTLGGSLIYHGSSVAATSETTGPLALSASSVASLTMLPDPTQASTFTVASYAQASTSSVGMIVFRAANLGGTPGAGTANVMITASPTLVGGGGAAGTPTVNILPYALTDTSQIGNGTTFATYGANGVRGLTNAEYTSDDFTVANANVNVAASDTVSGSASINALRLNNAGNVSGAGTVTVGSGEVLGLPGYSSISTAGLAFGTNAMDFDIQGNTTIGSVISGTNTLRGLVKLGPGELILTNNDSYTGPTRVAGGVLNIQNGSALGTSGATTTITGGGALQMQGNITVGSEVLNVNGFGFGGSSVSSTGALESVSGANVWQGNVTVGNGSIGVDTGSLTLSGTVTNNGLTKVGNGTLILSKALSSTGNTINIDGGYLISAATSGNPLSANTTLTDGGFGIAPTGSGGSISLSDTNSVSLTGDTALSVNKGSNTSATLTFTQAPTLTISSSSTLLIVPGHGISALGSTEKIMVPNGGYTAIIDGMVAAGIVGQNNDANLSGDFLTNDPTNGLKVVSYATSTNLNNPGFEPIFQANADQTLTGNQVIVSLKDNGHVIDLGTKQLAIENGVVNGQTGVIFNGGTIQNGQLEFSLNQGVIYTSLAGGTISASIDGSEGLTIFGPGKLTFSGTNTYSGGTAINGGNLDLTGTLATGAVSVAPGAILSGTGRVTNNIQGGLVSPGDQVGILTAGSVFAADATVALRNNTNFAFEFDQQGAPNFSSGTASGNDVLHLTSQTKPFGGPLGAGNVIDLYFNTGGALQPGQTYLGGFYTDLDAAFDSSIDNATYMVFESDPLGSTTFDGNTYSLYTGDIDVSTVPETANFASGTVNGYVMEVQIAPEPSSGLALASGAGLLALLRRRRQCR